MPVRGRKVKIKTTFKVSQASHGLSVGDAVYFNGTNWVKAQSDNISTIGTAIVNLVIDVNTFKLTTSGKISGLSGLTAGEFYFVSDSTPGLLTTTEGATYSNPILQATSTTEGIVLPYRASEVEASLDLSRLKWVDLVNTWTSEPVTEVYSGGDGDVLSYTYGSTVYYRFIPSTYDSSLDAFYTTYSDPTLSGLIATRGNTI